MSKIMKYSIQICFEILLMGISLNIPKGANLLQIKNANSVC